MVRPDETLSDPASGQHVPRWRQPGDLGVVAEVIRQAGALTMCVLTSGAASSTVLRRARPDDARQVADLYLASRAASADAIPSPVHSDADVRRHFAEVVLARDEVWVAHSPSLVGLLVLSGSSIDHLYLAPERTGMGLGSQLVALAKARRPDGLELWTFESNVGARRFYERHGFVAVARTDGTGNEEGAPDVRYRWRGGIAGPQT